MKSKGEWETIIAEKDRQIADAEKRAANAEARATEAERRLTIVGAMADRLAQSVAHAKADMEKVMAVAHKVPDAEPPGD